MGTHPIFESDFDCLTEKIKLKMSRLISTAVRRLALRPVAPMTTKIQMRAFFKKTETDPAAETSTTKAEAENEQSVSAAELVEQLAEKEKLIEKLTADLEAKETELDETKKDHRYKLSDLSMELKAQQDRFNREIEKTKATGIKSFAKSLFPVADQFSLAFDAVNVESLANNEELAVFYEGIEMTRGELMSAFERNNVTEVKPAIG